MEAALLHRMNKLRILVVEDMETTRFTIVTMLQQLGYKHVTDVEDGKKALEIMDEASLPFDLIISDWNMPHVSGSQLIRDIRTVYPKVPFLMITGRRDEESVQDAHKLGVNAYLGKPFTIEDLQNKITLLYKEISQKASNAHIETNRVLQKRYYSES